MNGTKIFFTKTFVTTTLNRSALCLKELRQCPWEADGDGRTDNTAADFVCRRLSASSNTQTLNMRSPSDLCRTSTHEIRWESRERTREPKDSPALPHTPTAAHSSAMRPVKRHPRTYKPPLTYCHPKSSHGPFAFAALEAVWAV